jgi:MFS family permease
MSLLPTCGRIYTCFNVKRSYCIALLVFEVGSVICAAAPNSITLILGRSIAGVGASGLMAGSAVIISHSVAIHKRATLFGMLSAIYGVASVAGPLIGGVLVDTPKLTWRFCFWINLRMYLAIVTSILHPNAGSSRRCIHHPDMADAQKPGPGSQGWTTLEAEAQTTRFTRCISSSLGYDMPVTGATVGRNRFCMV